MDALRNALWPPYRLAFSVVTLLFAFVVADLITFFGSAANDPLDPQLAGVFRALSVGAGITLAIVLLLGIGWAFLAWRRPPPLTASGTTPPPGGWPEDAPVTTTAERTVCVAAVVVLLASSIVYQEFDGLLRGFHPHGAAAYGAGAATDWNIIPHEVARRLCAGVEVWSRYARPNHIRRQSVWCPDVETEAALQLSAAGGRVGAISEPPLTNGRDPVDVLEWQLGVDSAALVPAYSVLLVLLILWLRRALARERLIIGGTADQNVSSPLASGDSDADSGVQPTGLTADHVRSFAPHAALAACGAALADWLENGLAVRVARALWQAYCEPGQPECANALAWPTGIPSWLFVAATSLKWVGLSVATLYLLWGAFLLARHGGADSAAAAQYWSRLPGARRAFGAVRVPILVIAAFALLLSMDQTPEIFWRWIDTPSVIAWAVGLTCLLAAVVYFTSRWLMGEAYQYSTGTLTPLGRSARRVILLGLFSGYLVSAFLLSGAERDLVAAAPERWPLLWKPFIPLIIVLVIWGVSHWQRHWPGSPYTPPAPGFGRLALPPLLASAVLVVLALGILGATSNLLLYNWLRGVSESGFYLGPLFALILMGIAVAWCWFDLRLPVPSSGQPWTLRPLLWIIVLVLSAAAWFAAVNGLRDPVERLIRAPQVGPVGLVVAALALVAAIGSSLVALLDQIFPRPNAFKPFQLAHTPVVSLLTLWFVAASCLPLEEDTHDVRFDPPRPWHFENKNDARSLPVTGLGNRLSGVFEAWVRNNCLRLPMARPQASKPVVPLVLVATSGGGIRAAAWTTYVMDAVFGYGPPGINCTQDATSLPPAAPRPLLLFAASGVSGGSVGLATYITRRTQRDPEPVRDTETRAKPTGRVPIECGADQQSSTAGWVRRQLGCDLLSPAMAWMLFAETPWSFLRIGLRTDRAVVLEQSWERVWLSEARGRPKAPNLFALRDGTDHGNGAVVPLLLLNGTSVESGCRFNGSVLDSDARAFSEVSTRCLSPLGLQAPGQGVLGATVDLVDFVCFRDEDIPLSTVAFLSARFPGISPAGHLKQCPSRLAKHDIPAETYVVDGGYLEGTASATILGLWSALQPLVEEFNRDEKGAALLLPVLLQISNGYEEPSPPGDIPTQLQFIAPITTYRATHAATEAMARQAAQLVFSKPYVVDWRWSSDDRLSPRTYCPRNGAPSRYAHLALRAHPGPQARLGWVLSSVAFDDLVLQFDQYRAVVAAIDRWFDGASLAAGIHDGHCAE